MGLLGMERRDRGAEAELGHWLGVRGLSYRNKCEGDTMMKQHQDGRSMGDTGTGVRVGD